MKLSTLLQLLGTYDDQSLHLYTVRIESESLVISKTTDVHEIEVNKED